ncbi:MAG: phosphatase PAP2 family protein [Planctomycetia bacterium]|nr:phosphatase PAP2 family protein [Planctomycetia bacterium]
MKRNPILISLVVTSLLVLLVSWLISNGSTEEIDTWLLRLNRDGGPEFHPAGSVKQQSVMRDITAMGSGTVLTSLTVLTLVFHLMNRQWKTGWFIALTILFGWFAMEGMKLLYQRERPTVVPHMMTESSLSLPSGHAMMSTVVFFTLASVYAKRTSHRRLQIFAYTVACLLVVLIGYTRVYLGVHHPSDVLAGWLLGLLWVQLAFILRSHWWRVE